MQNTILVMEADGQISKCLTTGTLKHVAWRIEECLALMREAVGDDALVTMYFDEKL